VPSASGVDDASPVRLERAPVGVFEALGVVLGGVAVGDLEDAAPDIAGVADAMSLLRRDHELLTRLGLHDTVADLHGQAGVEHHPHLIPHLVPTIIVYATLGIATTVLLEAMLSFLGRGVQPPTPAWGMMIFESQSYFLNAPWLVFIPGAAILIVALAFNLAGDGLRDALDPTQRGRR